MRPRHEFQLGELTVSYLIAQWHENDGERYDPFPEEIFVSGLKEHENGPSDQVLVEKCREDMLDRV